MNTITLYHFPKSSCSRKVVFVLAEKGLTYEEVIINLEHKEQKKSEFLAMNPHGQVPVLKYKSQVIYDSAVINEFLEEVFPVRPLLPQKPVARAQVRTSVFYADRQFYPRISRILQEVRQPPKSRNYAWIETAIQEFTIHELSFLEKSLQEAKPFLFGQLTLADIAYAPGLDTLMRVSGLTLDAYPATHKWFKEVTSLPSFQRTCAFQPAEAVLRST